jgi:hypothetical protein
MDILFSRRRYGDGVWQRHPLGMAMVIFTIKLSHPQAALEAATRHTPFEYAGELRID